MKKGFQGLIIGFVIGFLTIVIGSVLEDFVFDTLAFVISIITGSLLGMIGMIIGNYLDKSKPT